MKAPIILLVPVFGAVFGPPASAQTASSASPVPYAAASPVVVPDWKLPSPCNDGALQLLTAKVAWLVPSLEAEAGDDRCAGAPQPSPPGNPPPPSPSVDG